MIKIIYKIAEKLYPSLLIYRFIKGIIKMRRIKAQMSRFARSARKKVKDAKLKGKKINVAFMIWDTAMWKNDALFRRMQEHPLFRPVLWITKVNDNETTIGSQRVERCKEFAELKKYEYFIFNSFEEFKSAFQSDYIFVVQPYNIAIPFELEQLKNEIPCYIPYAYCTILDTGLFGERKLQGFYRCYIESEYVRSILSSYMLNKGGNLVASGLPMAAQLKDNVVNKVWPGVSSLMRKIIWAPHWSISSIPRETLALSISCFIEIADDFLELARRRDDLFFAFKPHPWLKEKLYQEETWGIDRTNQYFDAWARGDNTIVADGDYVALFQQSDAMIHDSSSFIHEYLLTDKPCMYLERGDSKANFNESTLRALACYQKGRTISDIEAFVDRTLKGEDPMTEKRREFVSSYLYPEGVSPVDRIIEDLLNP